MSSHAPRWFGLLLLALTLGRAQAADAVAAQPPPPAAPDWLMQAQAAPARLLRGRDDRELTLDNGIIRRVFRTAPNAATVGLDLLGTGTSLLRDVKPEARLVINGQTFDVGGLHGQPDHAYLLPEWLEKLTNNPAAFQFTGWSEGEMEQPFAWRRTRRAAPLPWPPAGQALDLRFQGPTEATRAITVSIHYEMLEGAPVVGKWLTISNGTSTAIRIDRLATELLGAVEAESAVDARPTNRWRMPPIAALSDYSFGGMDPVTSSRIAQWQPDADFTTQVHYERKTPVLLVCEPTLGPGVTLYPGATLKSFRTWLALFDSDSRERQGLTLRRAQRLLAPWCTENPVMMHVLRSDRKTFREAVDQCVATGFEMIIYTFGSGLNMESEDPAYLARVREDVDYAHSRGIQVGGYSLLSSRRIDDENDVINPATGKTGGAIFGNAPCLGSQWGIEYFRKLRNFIEATDFDLLEHDGPYPGDFCASRNHPGHEGLADSQWQQWRVSCDFYAWCRERGVYVNAPDYYFFAGTTKTAMGYREDNWSLPRAQQIIHGRQNIFDGTWEKTPSMGWMFVPLTQYQGGGDAATIEPLRDHLPDYAAHLANNFGAGVQACYRGPRLYDAEETREVVSRHVAWFKRHREILESDIIHLRRADGRDVDYFLHANPALAQCGLLMVFNPLNEAVERELRVPLHYTGLTEVAKVREQDGPLASYQLNRAGEILLKVRIPARANTWFVVERR